MAAPTVSTLQSQSPSYVSDRFAFLTKSNRLFVIQDGRTAEKLPPAGLRAGSVYVFGKNDLVLVDDRFEIFTSYDNGDHWQSYLGRVTEKKVRVDVSPGISGYYVYTREPPQALFGTYGRVDFRPIELPKDMEDLGLLRETLTGLYAERHISFFMESDPRPFFVRPSEKVAWEKRYMPAANCEHVRFLDRGGLSVSTKCSDRAVWAPGGKRQQYLSQDGGGTWRTK
jgi:hypothetical protein